MAVTTTKTNKPINPRGDDKSPLAFNRAKIYSGKALDFDGVNDNISFTDFEMTSGNKYTLCIYANRDNDGIIWSKDNQWIEIRFLSNVLQLRTYNNGVGSWTIYTLIDNVPANEWHQIIVTYDVDANTWKSYLNGQFIKSVTAAEPSNKIINRIGSSASTFYNGEFSNAKIFEVELTAAQVLELYNNPEKIVPTGVSNDALKLWLPMMEGAGTTAYDGSGNGNHGTISGATWTQGVGAPVAQSAVIDWNKGTNLLLQSNQFDTTWTISEGTILGGQTGYDGSSDAWLYTDNVGTTSKSHDVRQSISESGVNCFSIYAKMGTKAWVKMYNGLNTCFFNIDPNYVGNRVGTDNTLGGRIEDVGNGWFRLSVFDNGSASLVLFGIAGGDGSGNYISDGTGTIYIQNAQLESASTAGAYVLTFSTAQSSEVLIPQSLTSARDLFYNSFENVRKQYALNLDGQSWAEIHDNASVDLGSGQLSLESWVRVDELGVYQVILEKGQAGIGTTRGFMLRVRNNNLIQITITGDNEKQITSNAIVQGDWTHLCVTKDDLYINLYIDGVYITQATNPTGSIDTADPLFIGKDKTNGWQVNGSIAHPRIYNRALTADEVEQNYNAGKNTYS